MLPAPQRSLSTPAIRRREDAFDLEDDEGWEDMPVIRSTDSAPVGFDSEDDPRKKKYLVPGRVQEEEKDSAGNATGAALELDPNLTTDHNWRDKITQDESDYTRVRLFEDEESEEVHMRTKYLFNEDKAMTPLSQMQATKEMLTEGQRIAYVGLSALVAREMILDMGRGQIPNKKDKNKEHGVVTDGKLWMLKIMARLYQHMDLSPEEQRMIESLAEHGVMAADLVPTLMTTHTVKNPEYDPVAVKRKAEEHMEIITEDGDESAQVIDGEEVSALPPPPYTAKLERSSNSHVRTVNPFGDDDDNDEHGEVLSPGTKDKDQPEIPIFEEGMEEGDIAGSLQDMTLPSDGDITIPVRNETQNKVDTPQSPEQTRTTGPKPTTAAEVVERGQREEGPKHSEALPGVSTALSKTDENVTLDIRWTVLCDMFLQLIGDSVYDARSRVFLERVAAKLGLTWLDVTRFEKRVTDALEIQEGIERQEHGELIEGRAKQSKKRRIAMMGLATLGGGIVIGLSAGLLAPVIGAGLGAAFAGIGISGTTAFLGGAGGAALITTGGVVSGGAIAGKGMNRRTRQVKTFEFRPIHNNKRVNCFITVPGYMASSVDDVRLPFSTLDSILGDVFSIHWEPEMMNELGNALKILTSEVLSSVGTSVLGTTMMMGGLMSGLSLPVVLTKLGYLIDNPWSNALDRAYAAGLVLADVLIQRHAGVRPISLIGFSLGARVIFYALEELAKQGVFGIVQDVYLFGATITAPKSSWLSARSAVAGRFVNGYASNDWVLGYLFRATSGGINTVAGLRAVENIPGIENVDVTDKVAGHMSYRPCMPVLLETVGLPITADWFDEPDDPELDHSIQERTIVLEEENNAQQKKGRLWGIFPRKNLIRADSSTAKVTPPPSFSSEKKHDKVDDYDEAGGDGDITKATGTFTPPLVTPITQQELHPDNSASSSVTNSPKQATAGFDFKAISEVIGKNVDPSKVKIPSPSNDIRPEVKEVRDRVPLGRTGSAPPLGQYLPDDTEGDIGRSLSPANVPVTGGTIHVNTGTKTSATPPYLNEWSTGSTNITPPLNAPAARAFPSHVLESATNIFRADLDMKNGFQDDVTDDIGGDIGGFGSVLEDRWSRGNDAYKKDAWAPANPW